MTKTTILFLVALMALALAGCSVFRPGPGDVVKQFIRHVEAGETTEAAALLSGDLANNLGQDKLRRVLAEQTRQIQSKGGISNIEIVSEDVLGETAEVTAVTTYGNGSSQRENSKLIQKDGEWKITLSK